MKRSDSELAFEKYLNFNLLDNNNEPDSKHHEFDHDEEVKKFAADDGLDGETVLMPTTPNYHSSYWNIGPAPTLDSQSSMCGSGSGCAKGSCGGSDQSDMEEEAGSCELQSKGNDPVALKRLRRKVSNCESAQRSRRRKQAQLVDLEMQVEQMRGEHGCLYRRLGELGEVYQQADRCHQVLKSKVIALRAHIKYLALAHANNSSSYIRHPNLPLIASQNLARVAVAPSITLSSPNSLNDNTNTNTNNYLPLHSPSNTLPTSHLPL